MRPFWEQITINAISSLFTPALIACQMLSALIVRLKRFTFHYRGLRPIKKNKKKPPFAMLLKSYLLNDRLLSRWKKKKWKMFKRQTRRVTWFKFLNNWFFFFSPSKYALVLNLILAKGFQKGGGGNWTEAKWKNCAVVWRVHVWNVFLLIMDVVSSGPKSKTTMWSVY